MKYYTDIISTQESTKEEMINKQKTKQKSQRKTKIQSFKQKGHTSSYERRNKNINRIINNKSRWKNTIAKTNLESKKTKEILN